MCSKSSLSKILLGSLLILLTACDSKKVDSADEVTKALESGSLNVNIESVNEGKCLNVQKYFEAIRAFPAQVKARKMTTDFRNRTGNSLPRNYYLRLAAGNFQIVDTELSQLPDFPEMTQSGCDSITLTAEGHNDAYKIVDAKKTSLTFTNAWGGITTVTWLSPTSIQFDVTSSVSDLLCDGGSGGKITVTQQINWGDSTVFADSLAQNTISQNFLSLVAEATGASVNSLYTSPVTTELPPSEPDMGTTPPHDPPPVVGGDDGGDIQPPIQPVTLAEDIVPVDSNRRILVSRLKDLQNLPVRPELMQCY